MPNVLFYAGTLPDTRPPTVAIVGSRKPTSYGAEVTRKLAGELASRGVVIVSGLAYGVDAIAHEAALEAGGITIAVMAGGLHDIYPKAHTALAQRIVTQGGALISEAPLGKEIRKHHFLARNRLISGLADAVIVTEATEQSGTLSTVAHALSQNRDVYAVPGPITSLLSAGPNHLIQQGALVVLNTDDVLEHLAPQLIQQRLPLVMGDSEEEQHIITALRREALETDQLLQVHPGPIAPLLELLTLMELKGLVQNRAGKWYPRDHQ